MLLSERDRADPTLFPTWLYFFQATDNTDKGANANENGVINGVNRHLQSALSPLLQHSKTATKNAERIVCTIEEELERVQTVEAAMMVRTEENRRNIVQLNDKIDNLQLEMNANMAAILSSLRSMEQGKTIAPNN